MELTIDYLVVGAGASGLAFADTLIAESDADVLLVDRRHEPGGHWCDTYPFVRLHTPSRIYGVDSVSLGADRKQVGGDNDGLYEQATGKEVLDYFCRVLGSVLEPSGRVRFLGGHEHLGGSGGNHVVRDLASGVEQEVRVRRSLVDARYLEAEIPATHTPAFTVTPGVPFGPLNGLPDRADGSSTYTVIGGGKTGVDACLWLLDRGTDPEQIRWIRPREAWFNDRRTAQSLDLIGDTIQSISLAAEIIAGGCDPDTMLTQFEDAGQVMRLDQSTVPTMYRGSMLSIAEVERLKSITDVVRLGRLRTIEVDRLVLDDGEVTPRTDTLYVDCSSYGLRIATRRNDAHLNVANRETWTVTGCEPDGELTVTGDAGSRRLSAAYVHGCVELAYAMTVYGAQGETVCACHILVGEHSGASSAYVGMTRGRDRNAAHLVAESVEDARRQ